MLHFRTLALCLAVALAPAVAGDLAQISSVQVPRVSRPPRLEDFLSGVEPANQARIADFRQRTPQDGKPASRETTAYLSYDDKNFYAVFVCKSEPRAVRARMAKREDIGNDDVVGVYLDTFHDRKHAFSFFANALGIQKDSISTEGAGEDSSFDTLWYSHGRLTGDGFVVWMAIPFKSIRFSKSDVQNWGIALARINPRDSEEDFWPYLTYRVEGMAQQFGELAGLESISPGRNVQFIPYGIGSTARFLDRSGAPFFRSQNDFRGGLDSKVVLHDAFTLDLALNPDFSQVESDEPQVTVNQRFEVFFPEKRPFFIENASYFQTPVNLFFSRRISDPEFGGRLTGKAGKWLIGVLAADDRAPGQQLSGTDPHFGERALVGVARVQRELGRQSTIGALFTGRNFASGSNQVLSLDTRLKLSPNWVFSGQAMHSETRSRDRNRLVGPAYFGELARRGLHFMYRARYRDISPTFRTELGYVQRVDIRQGEQLIEYILRPNRYGIVQWGPFLSLIANWSHQGRMQDWNINPGVNINLVGPSYLTIQNMQAMELFRDIQFRKQTTMISLRSDLMKKVGLDGSFNFGTAVNYSPASGIKPFLANSQNASTGMTLRPSARFRMDERYYFSRLAARYNLGAAAQSGAAIFNNHILRSKVNYQFTRELSLRAILDYNAVLPNSALANLERDKRITGEILLTYLMHPGTALYVGYTDRRNNLALVPGANPELVRTSVPDLCTSRQVFVKLSYLLRF